MKDVLISIKPSWCLYIAIGAKTVELRKNRPRLKTPFKVYIYCTKSSKKAAGSEWMVLSLASSFATK